MQEASASILIKKTKKNPKDQIKLSALSLVPEDLKEKLQEVEKACDFIHTAGIL